MQDITQALRQGVKCGIVRDFHCYNSCNLAALAISPLRIWRDGCLYRREKTMPCNRGLSGTLCNNGSSSLWFT
jgi:hypothetical protein